MNVHSVSLKGLREDNEDKHIVLINSDSKNKQLNSVNFFAIFDGHGGRRVSEYLYKNLPQFFLNKNVKYPLKREYVKTVYDNIQNNLKKAGIAKRCGSTALIVINYKVNNENFLNILNTGDCRAILCRNNIAIPLTKDHKPKWPEEKHRITRLGGKITFDGYDYRIKDLSVSRAFGDIDTTPYVTHLPDIFKYKLEASDKFVILTCDGSLETICDHEMVNFILTNCYDSTLKKRINKNINIAEKLGEYAIKKGSTDNVTIIVIFFD